MIKQFRYLPFYEEKGQTEINGKIVKLCVNVANGTPMIVCDNLVFTMSWDEILERADKEGIAKEGPLCTT